MKTDLTITVDGTGYPVYVNDDGTFSAVLEHGSHVKADSYAELVKKSRRIQTRFELPFTRVDSDGVRHGTVTGIHASNRNLLIRWDNGETEQVPSYTGGGYMPRLTAEETAEAISLVEARNEAVQAFSKFMSARQYGSLKGAAEEERTRAAEQAK